MLLNCLLLLTMNSKSLVLKQCILFVQNSELMSITSSWKFVDEAIRRRTRMNCGNHTKMISFNQKEIVFCAYFRSIINDWQTVGSDKFIGTSRTSRWKIVIDTNFTHRKRRRANVVACRWLVASPSSIIVSAHRMHKSKTNYNEMKRDWKPTNERVLRYFFFIENNNFRFDCALVRCVVRCCCFFASHSHSVNDDAHILNW